MGDLLSISASIVSILQLTSTIVIYLHDVKDASGDRQRMLTEITSTMGLLYCLKDLTDREQERSPSTSAVRLLAVEDGPLSQFKRAMERLSLKLAPVAGIKKTVKTLAWPFQKREIGDIISIIERQKTYFLLALQKTDLELSQAIKDNIDRLHNGIDALGEQMGEIMSDTLSKDVLQWLKPVDPSTNHNLARKQHQPTTGAWLLGHQSYQDWKTSNGGLLWVNGKVGCGKTILCSTAVEDILAYCQTRKETSACYYYFDFQGAEKTRHETLIRTVLYRMALQSASCHKLLQSLFQRCQAGSQQPSHTQLLETLQVMFEVRPSTYMVIDALDECVDREELLSLIKQILDWKGGTHILAISRKERDIDDVLSACAKHQLNILSDDVDADIRSHVRRQIHDDPKLAAWSLEVQQEIEQTLASGANGMFRWVVCQIAAVRKCVKLDALRKTLGNLPNTLDETYQRIICSIDEEFMDDAIKILQWLTFSARPMFLDEIAEVVAIDLTQDPKFDRARRLRRPQDVVSICSSLVVVSAKQIQANLAEYPIGTSAFTGTIALAHLSVKDYLTSTRIVSTSAARFQISELGTHRCLAEMCLSYLTENSPKVMDVSSVDYPLSQYAAEFWTQHATAADSGSLYALITNIFVSSPDFLFSWVRLQEPDIPLLEKRLLRPFNICGSEASIGSPLYYASYCGLIDTVERLLASGADVNGRGARFINALSAASSQGHDKVVLRLIENGATENISVHPHNTAMVLAVRGGHLSTVRLLLSYGSLVTKDQLNYGLIAASYKCAVEIPLLLLERGADPNFVDESFNTPIDGAVRSGNESLVRLLLDHGADVAHIRDGHVAPLVSAAALGYTKILSILLAYIVDVNPFDPDILGPALVSSSRWGRTDVVQLLLDHGADIDALTESFGTPLLAAATRGNIEVVSILLAHGADTTYSHPTLGTALKIASDDGHDEIVRMIEAHEKWCMRKVKSLHV